MYNKHTSGKTYKTLQEKFGRTEKDNKSNLLLESTNIENNEPITESQKLFLKIGSEKINNIRNIKYTIFENTDYFPLNDLYKDFIKSKYYDNLLNENETYNKRKIIDNYFTETFSKIYEGTKLKLENEAGSWENIDFSKKFLLENTLDSLPEIALYLSSNKLNLEEINEAISISYLDPKYKQFEESGLIYGSMATAGAAVLGAGTWSALGIGSLTVLAMELLMPTSWSLKIDAVTKSFFIGLGRILAGTKSLLGSEIAPAGLQTSQRIIERFDNININKNVIDIINRIGTRNQFNTNSPTRLESLNVMVSKCLDNNTKFLKNNNIFERLKPNNIANNNIYKMVINSIFVQSGNRKDSGYEELLSFRKCLINSLTDLYKFLLISNLKDVKGGENIIGAMNKGFVSNPTQLLNFIDIRNEQANDLKENLLDLIKLRMFFTEMINEFKNGVFDVDRESGIFFDQKLKVIDREVADYLRNHKQDIDLLNTKKELNSLPPKMSTPFNKSYRPIPVNSTQVTPSTFETKDENETDASYNRPSRLNF